MAPPLFGQPAADDIPSPQALAFRRQLAQELMKQGLDTSPIRSWTQGLARVLQTGVGSLEANRADKGEASARTKASQQLADAIQSGDYRKVVSAASNPYVNESAVKLLGQTTLPQGIGTTSVTPEGVSQPGAIPPAAPQFQGRPGGAPGGVPQQPPPMASPASPQPLPQPPPQQAPPVQGAQPGIPGTAAPPVGLTQNTFNQRFAGQGVMPAVQNAMPTMDALAQRKQGLDAQNAQTQAHVKAVDDAINAGQGAAPKLANLNALKTVSDRLEDGGFLPRLQAYVKQTTGITPGANARNVDLFDSLLHQEVPDLAKDQRVPRGIADQYTKRGPELWMDKGARESIIQTVGMPYDLAVRGGQEALKGGSPAEVRQRIYSLKPDFNSIKGGVNIGGEAPTVGGPPAPNPKTIGGPPVAAGMTGQPTGPQTKTLGGKNYVKQNGQWFEQ